MGTLPSRIMLTRVLSQCARRAPPIRMPRRAQPLGAVARPRKLCAAAKQQVTVTIVEEGEEKTCTASVGTNLLDLAWDNDVDLEGACEKTLCCSTCHVYIQDEYFDKMP